MFMRLIKRLWSILRSPDAFFKSVAHENVSVPIRLFLVVLLISTIISIPAMFKAVQIETGVAFGEWLPEGLLLSLLGLVQGIVGYGLSIAVVHLFIRLFHGKGLISQTAKTILYPTAAMQALLIPFSVLYQIILFNLVSAETLQEGFGGVLVVGILYGLLGLVAGIMAFVATIKGIKTLHGLTTGRAVAAVILPLLIVLVLGLIVAFIVMLAVGPGILA
jgi:hypothetical protein